MKKSKYLRYRRTRRTSSEKIAQVLCAFALAVLVLVFVYICYSLASEESDITADVVEPVYILQESNESLDEQLAVQNKVNNIDVHNLSDEPNEAIVSDDIFIDRILSNEEKYLLAKIAMAEAEGCSTHVKALVILTVYNRVVSNQFPDTIEEVIFQQYNGVYQFTPIGDGRWNRVEPSEDCWKALELVTECGYDFSNGALFFESCVNPDNWHSRNLEFICEQEGVRFYK